MPGRREWNGFAGRAVKQQSEPVVVVVTNQIQLRTLPANTRESAGLGMASLGNLQHWWGNY